MITPEHHILLAIVEGSNDFIFVKDLSGRYIYVNHATASFFGRPAEEITGKTDRDLFPPEIACRLIGDDEKVIRAGESMNYEEWVHRPDGNTLHLLTTKSLFRDPSGRISGVIGISRDVTDRKLAEEALRTEHAYRKPIEEAMLAGVVAMANASGKLIYVNPAFCKIVGYSEQELLGLAPPFPFWPPEESDEIFKILKARFLMEQPPEIELRFQRKNGGKFPVLIKTAPLTDGYGNKIGIVSTIGDITVQKLSEAKLRESYQLLESIIEGTTDVVYLRDVSGRFLMINSSGAKLIGKKPQELIGRKFSDYFSPEFVAKRAYEDAGLLRSGKIESLEDRIVIDGRERVFLTTRGPIRNVDGEITGIFGIGREITERKMAEEALLRSEERFRRYFNLGLIGMAITSTDRRFIEVNDKLCDILGYERDELLGKSWTEFTHPDDISTSSLELGRLIAGEIEGCSIDKRYIHKDGHIVSTILGINTVRRQDRSIEYFVTLIQDISDRKRMEDDLRQSNEMITGLIQASPVGVLLLDPDGVVRMWNPEAERIFGWKAEEVIGKYIPIIPEEKKEEFKSNLSGVFQGKTTAGLETRRIRKGGDWVDISLWTVAVSDNQGNKRCLSIVTDNSEKLKLREELLKVQKLESLGILAGGIAHDFNNILTAVLGNVALGKSVLSPQEWLHSRLMDAEKACVRATNLSNQLLTFAKGGAPVKETVNLREILEHSVLFVLRGSNIRAELDIAPDLRLVNVDETQIGQVIQNIAINAMQAMPSGGIVKVKARNFLVEKRFEGTPLETGRYVEISIEDTGIGIPRDILPKIFDPYFTTKAKGSGLGLAISHSIIQRHGGHVSVKSTPDVGTLFTFYLPEAPINRLPGKETEEDFVKGTGKILVVDDDENVLQITGEMLKILGYQFEFASSGNEALQKFKAARKERTPFLLVITDLTMPGEMGGTELLQRVKLIDPDIPVIVSSGYSNEPVISNPGLYGFSGSIVKPYQPSALGKTLQRFIQSD